MEVQETAVQTDRVVTLPNALSLLRLLGVPLFLWLLLGPEADGWAVLVLMLSGASDWLDGKLARRWNQISRVGQLLDPLADRLYVVTVLLGLGLRDVVPWWLVALLLGRDLVLAATVPLLRSRGLVALPVHFLGKAATFCLLCGLPLVLLGAGGDALGFDVARAFGWAFTLWGTALYWWSAALYLVQLRGVLRAVPPDGGPR